MIHPSVSILAAESPTGARALLFVSATYPDGSLGQVMVRVTELTPEDLDGSRATLLATELIEYGRGIYHRVIGPAYSPGDMTFLIWFFDSPEEMFHACGEQLLATDGLIHDYVYPGAIG